MKFYISDSYGGKNKEKRRKKISSFELQIKKFNIALDFREILIEFIGRGGRLDPRTRQRTLMIEGEGLPAKCSPINRNND